MSSSSTDPRRALPRRGRGGAIIMAILTVALVAGIATAILGDYGHAVSHLSGRHDQAQARWLARGAVDWARNVLESLYRRGGANRVDTLAQEWAIKVPPTPVDEGEVSGEIVDQSGRFNVNSLVSDAGVMDTTQVAIFVRMLVALGTTEAQGTGMAHALVDWIDPDDTPVSAAGAESNWYRMQGNGAKLPPQAPLLDVAELAGVRGFDAGMLERLKPYVTALPGTYAKINVNTAAPEVLAGFIDGLDIDTAKAIVAARPLKGYATIEEFTRKLPSTAKYDTNKLVLTSMYFLATGRASWGDSVTRMEVLLKREKARPDIVWQKIL
ncbi:type II secretion system minor pseudopilin GspK [Uliginosibacterium sp. sgz301328]|uniref:type II secretion system minor pseudopilin GspK n=1 Tax=Uliginosibacterium sp. sgz301328 TaxID=3243764 RepID=UPI00359EA90B